MDTASTVPQDSSISAPYRTGARPTARELRRIDRHLVSLVAPDSFEAEQYRRLRHVIEELRSGQGGTVAAISSPIAGDGKSVTSINLAGALAQDRTAKVLVIDCDLRRQSTSLCQSFDSRFAEARGLTDVVINRAISLESVLVQLPAFNLAIVPTGQHQTGPYEVLRSRRFIEIVKEARRRFDYIIVDTPPIIALSDCKLIEKWVDGFVLVVAAHHTPRRFLKEALAALDRRKLLGVVFNCSDQVSVRNYGYEHYYGRSARRGGRSAAVNSWRTPKAASSDR